MPDFYALNNATLNAYTINGEPSPTFASGEGQIVAIEQSVQNLASGLVISFEQNVQFLATGSGLVVSIEQNIKAIQTGLIISFEQKVQAQNTFLTRNGFDCDIYINGNVVPKNQICGNITIRKEENKSGSLQFTILPPLGTQNPEAYQGKSVIVNLTDSTGTSRAFTGYVDTPTIDLIDNKIMFDCTDRRDTRLLGLPLSFVQPIGVYSVDIFGEPKNQADELDKRLSTVPACVDFDNFGTAKFTPWAPKTTADFTLTSSDIYYERPNVTYTNRTKTLNTVKFTVKYHFQRLHQQLAAVGWAGYSDFLSDWFNVGTPSFPLKDTIQSAAFAGDWKPIGSVNFTPLWPAGGYGTVSWQPNEVTNEYKQRTKALFLPFTVAPGVFTSIWPDGKKHVVEEVVLDVNGKPIYDLISQTTTDTSSMLCRAANWTAGIRFAQNVVYELNVNVTSPQAINRYGAIEDIANYDVTDKYDTSLWESGTKNFRTTQNFFLDQKNNYSSLIAALDCATRKARTSIQGAHRDASVNFQRKIWARVDLIHTVAISSTKVNCKGKVSAITHTINVETGEGRTAVTLLLSRSSGGDIASSLLVNTPLDDPSYIGTPKLIALATHVGQNPDPTITPGADLWNGYIGNKTTFNVATGTKTRTNFTETFIVDYPAIPESIRGDRVLDAESNFIITVPNDFLEVIF